MNTFCTFSSLQYKVSYFPPHLTGHTMKIQNVAVQLQLGESLIQLYTEHSLERQYFEGRYTFIYLGSLSTCTWQFF